MVDFVFPSKRHGWIYGVRGTIIGTKTWSETHVTSSGGGGHLHQGSGYIAAPTVRSSTVTKGEVWIKNQKGIDIQVNLQIPAIEGHEVVVLWGNTNDTKTGPYLYWHNLSAKREELLKPVDAKFCVTPEEKTKGQLWFWGTWIGSPIVAAMLSAYWGGARNSDGSWTDVGLVVGAILGLFLAVLVAKIYSQIIFVGVQKRFAHLLAELNELSLRQDLELNG